jgi:hypothetical protein
MSTTIADSQTREGRHARTWRPGLDRRLSGHVPAVIDDDGCPRLHEIDPPARYSDVTLSNQFANEFGQDLKFISAIKAWFHYREHGGR